MISSTQSRNKIPLDKIFAEALIEGCKDIIKSNVNSFNPYADLFISKLSKAKRISYSEAEALYGIYQRDPAYFITDFLHSRKPWGRAECGLPDTEPEIGQMSIIEAIKAGEKKIVVRSGNGVGKGWTAGRLVLWFLHCFPPSLVITTAPTNRGVEKLLWGEIRAAYRKALFQIGDCNLKELKFDDLWYAIGFSSTKEIENFQGYHSPNILVVVDEASGVDAMVMDALSRNLTSQNALWFLIGNPLNTSGPFFDCFKKSDWFKIHIDSEKSPNVLMGREVIPGLVSKQWIDQRKKDYGSGPLYQMTVKGEFSETGTNNLITLKSLNESKDCIPPDKSGRHLALDVARYGDDTNRAVLIVDNVVTDFRVWSNCNLMETVGRSKNLYDEWKIESPSNFHVDVCGLGAGVVDRLIEIGLEIDPVDFGAGPLGTLEYRDIVGDKLKFKNRRAELYYTLKRLLEEKRFCIPEHFGEAWADLTAPGYHFDSSGAIIIEAKEKVKETLGRSPDFGDAIVLCLNRRNQVKFRSLR